jgi:hypothetical protein
VDEVTRVESPPWAAEQGAAEQCDEEQHRQRLELYSAQIRQAEAEEWRTFWELYSRVDGDSTTALDSGLRT